MSAGVRKFFGAADTGRHMTADVHGAVNYLLEEKGFPVPAQAREFANLQQN